MSFRCNGYKCQIQDAHTRDVRACRHPYSLGYSRSPGVHGIHRHSPSRPASTLHLGDTGSKKWWGLRNLFCDSRHIKGGPGRRCCGSGTFELGFWHEKMLSLGLLIFKIRPGKSFCSPIMALFYWPTGSISVGYGAKSDAGIKNLGSMRLSRVVLWIRIRMFFWPPGSGGFGGRRSILGVTGR